MEENFENQWAIALKKSKQQSNFSLTDRQKNIKDKIDFQKEKLKKGLYEKNEIETRQAYNTLVKLRAELCALKILQAQKNGQLDEKMQTRLIMDYATDCLKLESIINK